MAKTVAGGKARVVQAEGTKRKQGRSAAKGTAGKEAAPDFDAIEASAGFRDLMKKKKALDNINRLC